jgi:hypothetical protein
MVEPSGLLGRPTTRRQMRPGSSTRQPHLALSISGLNPLISMSPTKPTCTGSGLTTPTLRLPCERRRPGTMIQRGRSESFLTGFLQDSTFLSPLLLVCTRGSAAPGSNDLPFESTGDGGPCTPAIQSLQRMFQDGSSGEGAVDLRGCYADQSSPPVRHTACSRAVQGSGRRIFRHPPAGYTFNRQYRDRREGSIIFLQITPMEFRKSGAEPALLRRIFVRKDVVIWPALL